MTRPVHSEAPSASVANHLQQAQTRQSPGHDPSFSPLSSSPTTSQASPLLGALISLGVRMTSQRRLLVNLIQEGSTPLDAAALLAVAQQRDSSVDRATVYRTLALLRSKGLVEVPARAGQQSERDAQTAPGHDHGRLSCLRCGGVEGLSSGAIAKMKTTLTRRCGFGFGAGSLRIEARGHCSACTRALQKPRGAKQPRRARHR